jgi:hypothetical protein
MKVTKTLRRICVLALLTSAFLVLGEGAGVKAQSQDACGCLDDRTSCYSDAQSSRSQCDQSAASQYDSCTANAYDSAGSCQENCYYDYYWSGGYYDLNDCYNQCGEQMNDELSYCGEMFNSELSSCASSEYQDYRFCDEMYDDCIIHCPI